jgi:hypothetical protein
LYRQVQNLKERKAILAPKIIESNAIRENALALLEAEQISLYEYLQDIELAHEFILDYYDLEYAYFSKLAEIRNLTVH